MTLVPQAVDVPAIDIARSLANIHQICVAHREDLQKISQTKVKLNVYVQTQLFKRLKMVSKCPLKIGSSTHWMDPC